MVNSMDKVFTSIHKEGEKKANGIKGRELDGSIKHKPLSDDDNDDDDDLKSKFIFEKFNYKLIFYDLVFNLDIKLNKNVKKIR